MARRWEYISMLIVWSILYGNSVCHVVSWLLVGYYSLEKRLRPFIENTNLIGTMAKSASKPVVDPNLLELDQIAETELQRLQKQVNLL